jgi:glycosyltransferase involved in cell wall biosynthesis
MTGTRPLRIAMLAPATWRGDAQAPRERIASVLTDALVARGVQVSLLSTPDAAASLLLGVSQPGGPSEPSSRATRAVECLHVAAAIKRAAECDVIHDHCGPLSLGYLATIATPVVATHHERLTATQRAGYRRRAGQILNVAPSAAAREPGLGYAATIHHGVDVAAYTFSDRGGDFLLFLEPIGPEHGVREAIAIATRSKLRLLMAGRIADRAFYQEHVAPRVNWRSVLYVGVAEGKVREALLSGAAALLYPKRRGEPFAFSAIEAMACGTPVIGFRRGCLPELVQDGRTGFVVDDVAGAVEALRRLPALRRRDCRAWVEARFNGERMAAEYLQVYERATGGLRRMTGRRRTVVVAPDREVACG